VENRRQQVTPDSIAPPLSTQGRAVQLISNVLPVGQQPVHVRSESIVVVPFENMDQFMDDDEFQATFWLFG
jgi:hypothetical protein